MTGSVGQMDARSWVDRFAAALGVETPDDESFEALLQLAGTAAHDSQRQAAPIACYLLGRAGVDVHTGRTLAEGLRER